jgi:hypothetical protein
MLKTGGRDEEYPIGIKFYRADNFSIFETNRVQKHYRDNTPGYYPTLAMPMIRLVGEGDITESKLIDSKTIYCKDGLSTGNISLNISTHLQARLFELAGVQYLLDYKPEDKILGVLNWVTFDGRSGGVPIHDKSYYIGSYHNRGNQRKCIYKVPVRVQTVADARTVLLPDIARYNIDTVRWINGVWLNEMSAGFSPPPISIEDRKALTYPPVNPYIVIVV